MSQILKLFGFVVVLILVNLGEVQAAQRYVLMWQVQNDVTDKDLQLLRSKGVNIIQTFWVHKWGDDQIKQYLDRAQAHNMKVIFSFTLLLTKNSTDNYTLDDRAATIINKWKTHPAVFAWHTIDEPAKAHRLIPSKDQEAIYNFVKRLDPSHPVLVSGNWVREQQFRCCFSEKAFDILDIHAYSPNPGVRQEKLVEQFLAHRTRNYPVIITLKVSGSKNMPKWPPDGLRNQYNFFFKQRNITPNVGFFAWQLNPRIAAISNDPDLKKQFLSLDF